MGFPFLDPSIELTIIYNVLLNSIWIRIWAYPTWFRKAAWIQSIDGIVGDKAAMVYIASSESNWVILNKPS